MNKLDRSVEQSLNLYAKLKTACQVYWSYHQKLPTDADVPKAELSEDERPEGIPDDASYGTYYRVVIDTDDGLKQCNVQVHRKNVSQIRVYRKVSDVLR